MTPEEQARVADKLVAAYSARLVGIDEHKLRPISDAQAVGRAAEADLAAQQTHLRSRSIAAVFVAAAVVAAAVVAIAVAVGRSGDGASPRPVIPPATSLPTVPTSSSLAASPTATHTPSATRTASAPRPPTAAEIDDVMVRTYEFPDAEEHFDAGGAQPTTVSDGAGGTFTAVIGARTPNADGKGTLVFFWHNDRFVGWDNDVEAFVTRSLVASGVGRFDVTYSNYAAEDAACCPSKPRVTITFRWNGSRFSPTTPIPLGVYDLDKNSYAHPLTVVLQQSRPSFVWANHTLIISSYALGGAVIGMTSDQAARAAGVSSFTAVGDGVLVPSGHDSDNPHLYLGNFAGQPASKLQGSFSCVGASLNDARPATQDVVTTEGLRLGDPATRVRDIYGASAIYVPLPSTGGLDPHAGYVVNEGAFDLVFKLDSTGSRVIAIAGGLAPMTPSECNG